MQLFLNATSPPALNGSSRGLNLTASGDLTVSVILDNKTLTTAFTVAVVSYLVTSQVVGLWVYSLTKPVSQGHVQRQEVQCQEVQG